MVILFFPIHFLSHNRRFMLDNFIWWMKHCQLMREQQWCTHLRFIDSWPQSNLFFNRFNANFHNGRTLNGFPMFRCLFRTVLFHFIAINLWFSINKLKLDNFWSYDKIDAFKSYSSICAKITWPHEKCLHSHINMHFIYIRRPLNIS